MCSVFGPVELGIHHSGLQIHSLRKKVHPAPDSEVCRPSFHPSADVLKLQTHVVLRSGGMGLLERLSMELHGALLIEKLCATLYNTLLRSL